MNKNLENIDELISDDEIIEIKKPTKKRIYKKKEDKDNKIIIEDQFIDIPLEDPIPQEPPQEIPEKKEKTPAQKKEKTPAQKLAWEKAIKKRAENREQRKIIKEQDEKLLLDYKKQLAKKAEKKIVKKAVGIKKKAIMRNEQLDEISDEDIPIEYIREKIRETRKTPITQSKNKCFELSFF